MDNIKTPVMALQELAIKKFQMPEYSLIYTDEGTHLNEFHVQVSLNDMCVVGVGNSKQNAKHDAAQKMLDKLAPLGISVSEHIVIKKPEKSKKLTNSIGVLTEMCVKNKLIPKFTLINKVGLPHCSNFTYQCEVASIITKATAGTKKQAKQMAAKDMLDKIQSLPELGFVIIENENAV